MARSAWSAMDFGIHGRIAPTSVAGLLGAAILAGAIPRSACGAEGPDVTLPESDPRNPASSAVISDPPAPERGATDMFSSWQASVAQVRATQPNWSSPLVTTTGLLEQRLRFDVSRQHAGNGTDSTVLDGGKGLDLIVNETTEIQIADVPYFTRSGVSGTGRTQKGAVMPLSGFGDWPFFRIEKRLFSSPASDGNYVITALLQIQAPSGNERLTNDAWLYQPTLAFGKGWGAFDIQGTLGGGIPASRASVIGYQVQTNIALQYNVLKVFWPELEVNWTYYANGQRGGLNQVYLTPGVVVGRFILPNGMKFTFGVGYQAAITPTYIPKPLTPAFDHAWLFTTRLNF